MRVKPQTLHLEPAPALARPNLLYWLDMKVMVSSHVTDPALEALDGGGFLESGWA